MNHIDVHLPDMLGMRGYYRAVLRNPDESIAYDSGWERNLITTFGISKYALQVNFANWNTYCHIGSSGTAPSIANTTLGTWLAQQSTTQPGSTKGNYGVGGDYGHWSVATYRFGAGVATDTIREMGMGFNSSNPSYIFSRHVLTVPIVKAANQSLDVSYKFEVYPSLIAVGGTVTIGGVSYTTSTSMYNVQSAAYDIFQRFTIATAGTNQRVYDGTPSALTGTTPTGNQDLGTSASQNNFTANSFDHSSFFGLNDGNTATNQIRVATLFSFLGFYFQTQFLDGSGNGIPKTPEFELTLNWRLTWGARP